MKMNHKLILGLVSFFSISAFAVAGSEKTVETKTQISAGVESETKSGEAKQDDSPYSFSTTGLEESSVKRAHEIESTWESGQPKQAFKAVDKWIDEDKKSPVPHTLKASLYFRSGKIGSCLSITKKMTVKYSDYAEAFFWQGRALEAKKNFLEAGNEYRAALHLEPGHSGALEGLDRIANHLGDSTVIEEDNSSPGTP